MNNKEEIFDELYSKLGSLKNIVSVLEEENLSTLNSNENIKNINKELHSKLDLLNNTVITLEKDNDSYKTKIEEIKQENKNLSTEINKVSLYNSGEENLFTLNDKNLTLGINDLEIKNKEAIHDAMTFFDKKCPYCNNDLYNTTQRKPYEIDHFLPINKGGQDFPWNILPVCQQCNRQKKDKLPHEFLNHEKFIQSLDYLNNVKNKYLQASIESYTEIKKIKDLILEEFDFIKKHNKSPFISKLLYLVDAIDATIFDESIEEKAVSVIDDRIALVEDYLNMPVPIDWNRKTLKERRMYRQDPSKWSGEPVDKIATIAIWFEVLNTQSIELSSFSSSESYLVRSLLMQIKGMRPSKRTIRYKAYAQQRTWERENQL